MLQIIIVKTKYEQTKPQLFGKLSIFMKKYTNPAHKKLQNKPVVHNVNGEGRSYSSIYILFKIIYLIKINQFII